MALITPEVISAHNLTPEEFERIKSLMGRAPGLVELGIFSVMWSEHCSYKSSRIHLRRLPTTGERIIVPPGENAGIVDVGDGWCAAFKIESHNHPSFIEPFQGAATGVGGILRDVFTMGARPIASMNSLRFGSLDHPKYGRRNRSLLAGVVGGIAHYGNAFGVATVGGEVAFDDAYSLNPLVNAFALGLVRQDQIFFGKATGVGNPILYVGAKTGRDGIHGATMASAEFDEEALEKRPTVQVGDPFLEKLLLEACLEAMRSGAVAGIQDMGAAGLTSSSCEMAARAGTGIEINLSLVPQREVGMTAYEMLLSESQERMLIVAHSGREREVIDIFRKWDLDAVVIGRVREGRNMRVIHNGDPVADIPVSALTDEAPLYERPMTSAKSQVQSPKSKDQSTKIKDQNYNDALLKLLASPNLASKQFVYRQYDHMVRTNTAVLPGADAAVVRIKETRRALAMSLDGNGRYCAVNPREGAKLIVAEAARNVVCVGARPLAITNCLNFASPERPEVMWSFSEVIDGMAEACRAFDTPVVSGNVSFYNETEGRGILPTPVIGMIGLVEDVRRVVQPGFKKEAEVIALLGTTGDDLSVSEYAATIDGLSTEEMIGSGAVAKLDLQTERAVQNVCLQAAEAGLLASAHDCSDGGLAVALAECCFSFLNRAAIGADVDLPASLTESIPATSTLFGESPSRIIISFQASSRAAIEKIAQRQNCPFTLLGHAGGQTLRIKLAGEEAVSLNVSEMENVWRSSLARRLEAEVMVAGME
ncbi:MAG TPA: phosphoribosylformylglycinamidine synthase subunit PurL [Blastocatellia bacterium]|jgi:phosphoribosylformylglycinamidine synthase|nr:phosphoribosylformylglycinamidine synthase subunit PurL [Blastocatellia bacterium]HAF23408.1 phosphoribosylformylglycinamidine synthase subunit PurL [Blastocatellia bacterium]HCX29160.1 phosphoribosylformylglycinamidine synthase subunit PurL [Blastocatellia bacterium]